MNTVSWGAAIPTEWPRKRIKYLCRFAGGGTPDKGNPQYWNGDIPWVSPKDMKSATIDATEEHITEDGLESSASKLVAPGAVLIVMRSGILRHSIPVAINRVSIAMNQDVRALIPVPQIDARFLARLLEGHQRQLLNAWSKVGSTVESLESDLIRETEVAVPALGRQRAIADYLDRETARLDALVEAKGRVLGLLEEKRRAFIDRAVTQGLDASVLLRDSGIPCLGEIPAHWVVERLKFLVTGVDQGSSPQCFSVPADPGSLGVLKAGCANGGQFREHENKALPPEIDTDESHLISRGDILMSRASGSAELVGSVAMVEQEPTANLLLSDKVFRLRYDPTRTSGRFLVLSMGTTVFRLQIASIISGAEGLPNNIAKSDVLELLIAVPPFDEQRSIVENLDRKVPALNALANMSRDTISLLKERRSALIAAAITGQIEIRATS